VEVYVVITVFQGVFDDVSPFKTEKEANEFVAKLKADWVDEPDLDIIKKRLELP